MNNKSGKKTMLFSILLSLPGPLVVGLGLMVGKSSTQIADFVRRSAELLAIILAYITYSFTTKDGITNLSKKEQLEKASNIFVGITMILSGIIMMLLAIFYPTFDKGNVIPGLVIAILGFIANSIFWAKYNKLGSQTNNNILIVQSKLYRAKTFVDASVMIALLVVLIIPHSKISYYFDLVGTIIVSIYLIITGVDTLVKIFKNKDCVLLEE